MILLTGANGFIGSVLLRTLNSNSIEDILACDFVSPGERPQLLEGAGISDFVYPDTLLSKLDDWPIKEVIHIGACSSTTENNWDYLKEVNLDFSKALFSHCARKGIPFFYASSGAVYGNGEHGFDDTNDSQIYKPLNLYGKSKCDFDIWAAQQELAPPRWYGFRFFNVFGPNEYFKGDMASVVYKAFHQIQESGTIRLFKSHNPEYGDGQQMRDFVYVKDIVQWILEFRNDVKFQSGIYNMGFGQARTWNDLAQALFKAMGKNVSIQWIDVPQNIREQYQYFTCAKMEKAFGQGLSAPKWSLENAVNDYVTSYLLQKDPYYK